MKNGILNELISTMRERIPQDMNLANTLLTFYAWERKLSIAD